MAQKRSPDEEKSDFGFLAFLVLYYIHKACVKILWQYIKYFFEIWPFYILASLLTLLLFSIDFSFFFLVFNNVAYRTLRSTTFLLLFLIGY